MRRQLRAAAAAGAGQSQSVAGQSPPGRLFSLPWISPIFLATGSSMFLLAHLAAACFLTSGARVAPAPAAPRRDVLPTWRVDLRPAIGGPLVGVQLGGEQSGAPAVSLGYLDADTIVASFVTRAAPGALVPRGAPAFALHLIFILPSSGASTRAVVWPAVTDNAAIIWAARGKFLVRDGARLALYSRQLRPLGETSLPDNDWHALNINSYPSIGDYLLFVKWRSPPGAASWLALDAQALTWRDRWDSGPISQAIGPEGVIVGIGQDAARCRQSLLVKPPGTPWRRVGADQWWMSTDTPTFVGPGLLMLRIAPPPTYLGPSLGCDLSADVVGLAILSLRSHRILAVDNAVRAEAGTRYWMVRLYATGTPGRAAVLSFVIKHPLFALDPTGRALLREIILYDAPAYSRSFTLRLKGPTIELWPTFRAALSPDGLHAAILSGTTVEMFALPPPAPANRNP